MQPSHRDLQPQTPKYLIPTHTGTTAQCRTPCIGTNHTSKGPRNRLRGHDVTRRDILTCFIMCRKSFCVTAAILLHRFQKMTSILCGRGSTLETSIVFLRGRRSTLDMSRWVVFANRSVRTASLGDNSQIPSRCGTWWERRFACQGQYLVEMCCVWNVILRCMRGFEHFTLRTLHFTLYTSHFILTTPDSTLYILHFRHV